MDSILQNTIKSVYIMANTVGSGAMKQQIFFIWQFTEDIIVDDD